MTVRVDDYSTATGLRVRISCDTTGTTIQMPAEDWEQLVFDIKTGAYEGIAKKPNIPFIY